MTLFLFARLYDKLGSGWNGLGGKWIGLMEKGHHVGIEHRFRDKSWMQQDGLTEGIAGQGIHKAR